MKNTKRIFTHSELATAKDCLQKWEYRYLIGWRSMFPSIPTIEGKAIHAALADYYAGSPLGECMNKIDRIFSAYITRVKIEQIDELQESRELCLKVFMNYVEYWRDHGDFSPAKHPQTGAPLIEVNFRVPVVTPSGRVSRVHQLAGSIDLIVQDKEGLFWVCDHKTKDFISDTMGERMVLDQQLRIYSWAAQLYLGIPIEGAIYNAIRKKTPSQVKINKDGTPSLAKSDTTVEALCAMLEKQDETLRGLSEDDWKKYSKIAGRKLARCIDFDAYAPEVARLRGVRWFERFHQPYNEDDYRLIQAEVYQVCKSVHEAEFYPKNDSACDHWGGCPYRPICMGLNPEDYFELGSEKHAELDKIEDRPCLLKGKPFKPMACSGKKSVVCENSGEIEQKTGFAAILDAVNY